MNSRQIWRRVTHEARPGGACGALKLGMYEPSNEMCRVVVGTLGERLSGLRLCSSSALEGVRRSLAQHGQLSALTLYRAGEQLEIIDGFKRVQAARSLGLPTLLACVDKVTSIEAKLRLSVLSERCGLTELEEGWLVRSLYRDDAQSLPEIARHLGRHRSWVWRRLMLVESLEPEVQADVRLGLLMPRAAVAVSRLPRGNQAAASAVVMRRGLTVRQAEQLVEQALSEQNESSRAEWLARRLNERSAVPHPGPRATRAVRNEADWISADIMKVREVSARLSARLSATPLTTFTPVVSELLHEALTMLPPVLRALDSTISDVTQQRNVA